MLTLKIKNHFMLGFSFEPKNCLKVSFKTFMTIAEAYFLLIKRMSFLFLFLQKKAKAGLTSLTNNRMTRFHSFVIFGALSHSQCVPMKEI